MNFEPPDPVLAYMEEAQRLCDRVAIMDRGRLLAVGTVQELIAAHGGRHVLRAEGPEGDWELETDDPVAELARLGQSHRLARIRLEGPNLERVFLNLTGRALRD